MHPKVREGTCPPRHLSDHVAVATGSKFFKNEERKDRELTIKVNGLVAKLDALVAVRLGDLEDEEHMVDEMIVKLQVTRDTSQTLVVVDCDAFFCS